MIVLRDVTPCNFVLGEVVVIQTKNTTSHSAKVI